jgi:ankyrin repeat protein
MQDEHGNTVLHIGCQNGHKRIVKMCLRLGADINFQNVRCSSALCVSLS